MEENTGLSLPDNSSLVNLTKGTIAEMVAHVAHNLNEGFEDPVKALVVGKKIEELAKQYNAAIRPLVSGKIKLQKGETYRIYDVEIKEEETGVKYDYSVCDDGEWNMLTAQIEPLIEKRKARESFLKTIRKEHIDEDTGEIIQPPLRTGTLGYKLSIKK